MTRRVDAHHHVWPLARGDYGWLTPALAPIYRDFTLADLRAAARRGRRSTTTVLVQAAPTRRRNRVPARRRAAQRRPRARASSAGSISPRRTRSPTLDAARARSAAEIDTADAAGPCRIPTGSCAPTCGRALAALPRLGLRFDALVKPRAFARAAAMLDRHPDLAVVIDHGAKPPSPSAMWEPWASSMRAARDIRRSAASCPGSRPRPDRTGPIDTLRRYVDHLLECFGPQRLHVGQRLAGRRSGAAATSAGARRPTRCWRGFRSGERDGDHGRQRAPLLRALTGPTPRARF